MRDMVSSDLLHDSRIEAALSTARPAQSTPLRRRLEVAAIMGAIEGKAPAIRLGGLEVRGKFGVGGLGAVYEAFDPELERVVAVKVLHEQSSQEDEQRIIGEARALARLSHPGVVTIYDVVSSGGDVYLTMEYVDGATLSAWRREHPDAPWGEVVRLLVQAARGLAAAHEAGLVHRDFKPENVLVGRDGRVRVVDFGLAFAHTEGAEGASARHMAGTPRYMAPEVRRGGAATPASDQWSFCVTVCDVLRVSGNSATRVPVRLQPIVTRGLDDDPLQRWPSMQALADALARALEPGADRRHRDLMLDRVEAFWLRGMLAQSLSLTDGEPLALNLELALEHVTSPWDGLGTTPYQEDRRWTTSDLEELLASSHHALLILGEPGAGKTTAMLLLAQVLLTNARLDPDQPSPIVLSLGSFDPKRGPLEDWVVAELVTKYSIPSQRARAWLERDDLVLLLDGLDEVATSRRRACLRAIDSFRREHPVPMAVSCREAEYCALGTKLRFGAAVRVAPLDDAQVDAWLRSLRIDGVPDAELREQLRNPLMLGLLASSGRDTGVERFDEASSTTLLRRYVDHALRRDNPGSTSRTQIVEGLVWIAAAMRRTNTADLWLERLQARWLARPWERWVARGLGAAIISIVTFGNNLAVQLAVGLELTPTILTSALAVVFVWVFVRGLHIRPVEALGWSWKRAVRLLPVTLGCTMAGGVVMGLRMLVFGPDSGMNEADAQMLLISNLSVAFMLGIAGAIVLAIVPGDRENRVRPNEGIMQSLRNGLLIAVPSAVVVAVALAYIAIPHGVGAWVELRGVWVDPFPLAVRFAGLFAHFMFFIYGGAAVVLHVALRVLIALRSPLPLRLVPFLEHAADRGLLRRVGGGYFFMHRTLLEHFADLGSTPASETHPG